MNTSVNHEYSSFFIKRSTGMWWDRNWRSNYYTAIYCGNLYRLFNIIWTEKLKIGTVSKMLLYFIQIIQLSIIMSLKKNGCNNYCLWILWFDLIVYQIELLEKNVNGNLTIKLYDKLVKYNFSMTTSHTYVSIYHRYMLMEFMF